LKFPVSNLQGFVILEVHPEGVEPFSEKEGENGQHGGNGDDYPDKRVFGNGFCSALLIVKV